MERRRFIGSAIGATWGLVGLSACNERRIGPGGPRVISTWNFGLAANAVALRILESGGSPVDAVESGVMVSEADPAIDSVGYGGVPNSDGVVELDAAIMDGQTLQAGSVASLQDIMHPVAVARRVMERTPHVLLVGAGARRYAIEQGFPAENLLTPEALARWEALRLKELEREAAGKPEGETTSVDGLAGHDTIGMVALDASGKMAAACTTSGLARKMPGRVGDSPLIGHGLYCDASVGGAAATGVGEEVIKVCGSYQVVEFMRQGIEPDEAVRRVLRRILARDERNRARFVGFVALRADGAVGYASTTPGFQVAISGPGEQHEVLPAQALGPRAAES